MSSAVIFVFTEYSNRTRNFGFRPGQGQVRPGQLTLRAFKMTPFLLNRETRSGTVHVLFR